MQVRVPLGAARKGETVAGTETGPPGTGPPGTGPPRTGPPRAMPHLLSRVLASIAQQSIGLLTGEDQRRLRACRAPGCVQYFVKDRLRPEWCSSSCGNRARAARHYRRHRKRARADWLRATAARSSSYPTQCSRRRDSPAASMRWPAAGRCGTWHLRSWIRPVDATPWCLRPGCRGMPWSATPTRPAMTGSASGAGDVMSRRTRLPSTARSKSRNPQHAASLRTRSMAVSQTAGCSHSRMPPGMDSTPVPAWSRSRCHSVVRARRSSAVSNSHATVTWRCSQ